MAAVEGGGSAMVFCLSVDKSSFESLQMFALRSCSSGLKLKSGVQFPGQSEAPLLRNFHLDHLGALLVSDSCARFDDSSIAPTFY